VTVLTRATRTLVDGLVATLPTALKRPSKTAVARNAAAGWKIVAHARAHRRRTDAEGSIELRVVKPGEGTLAADGVALEAQAPKTLPSSD
jgi:hypothetical protein